MIVLELVPSKIAAEITKLLHIPTIGIGAGPFCDGQVQVFNDMLGLSPVSYKHTKAFTNGKEVFAKAVVRYVKAVRKRTFPTQANAPLLSDTVIGEVRNWLKLKNSAAIAARKRPMA
jgi:3-methyl-2-oxobutanoate hydroxymethyltransferase